MLKVSSGKYKFKRLKEVQDKTITRPSKDIDKLALSNIINYYLVNNLDISNKNNLSFLDLFSGTGQIGIEMLSKDIFSLVIFNDKSKEAIKVIKENLTLLNDEQYLNEHTLLLNKDYLDTLKYIASSKELRIYLPLNVIFLDPPYKDIINYDFILKLYKLNLISKDSLIIIESDKDLDKSIVDNIDLSKSSNLIKEYKYGRSKLYLIKVDL